MIDENLSEIRNFEGLTRMRFADSRTTGTYVRTKRTLLTNPDRSVTATMRPNRAPTRDSGRPSNSDPSAEVAPVSRGPAAATTRAAMAVTAGLEHPANAERGSTAQTKRCWSSPTSVAASTETRFVASAAATVPTIPTSRRPSVGTVERVLAPRAWPANARSRRAARALAVAAIAAGVAAGQPAGFNYDEAKVPEYELPEILRMADGEAVETVADWDARRTEILRIFERQVYGAAPEAPPNMRFSVLEESVAALGGLARRKQVRVDFSGTAGGPGMELLLYTPAAATGPVAVFAGLNFGGNHTVHPDPAIHLGKGWVRDGEGVVENRSTEQTRGRSASRWQLERVLKRGYGLATVYCGDLDPDFDDGFRNGVHRLAPPRTPADWGSIAAWAWGLSRALDYLATDSLVNASRVAVIGHSRLGKTALWTGARDPRFAMVISNDSGCGGAALSRRRFGETVERINTRFPHWFAENFKRYNGKEDDLPVDQHMLLALVAPRPLYVASAEDDAWADPKGEFLAAMHAGEAYELLGKRGLRVAEQPGVNEPVMQDVAYHVRSGKHDVTAYDWERYLDFADKHWKLD